MSPLTGSYFTCWAFFGLQFDGADTLATCLIDANDVVCMTPDQLDALQKMADSRMGIDDPSRLDAVFDGVVVPPTACDQQTNPYDENFPNWGTINATS